MNKPNLGARNISMVFLMVSLWMLSSAARAQILLSDDFSGVAGAPPDAAKYVWNGDVTQNGSGQLNVNTLSYRNSWIYSRTNAAPGSGQTLVLQMRAYAYAENWDPGVYGDRQPRGLRVGTDANNCAEFYSDARTSVGMRVRKDGVESASTYPLPAGVDSMHDYEISVTATSAVFKVDGTVAGTFTQNIPTGALNFHVSTYNSFGNVPVTLDSLRLSLSNSAVVAAPSVTTSSATNITATGTNAVATLNGTINPNGADTTAWFEWGRTRSYGHQSQTIMVTSTTAISASASILAGFPYHYRAVASNSAGCTYGKDQTFWSPRLELAGPAVVTNAYGVNYVEPGVAAKGAPLAIAAGFASSIALKADGSVVGWGAYAPPDGITNVVAISAGDTAFIALRPDHTITNMWFIPPVASNVVAIAAGDLHNLVLLDNGTVVAWGHNDWGQTNVPAGLTNIVALAAGGDQSLALGSDGTITQWGYQLGTAPADATNVTALAMGAYHTVALRANGTVIAWGSNDDGQTNVPVDLTNAISVAAAGHHSMALRSNGRITGWGFNPYGEVSAPAEATNMVEIATGYYHSLGVRDDGAVLGWGINNYNQNDAPTNLMTLSFPVGSIGTVDCYRPGTCTLTYRTTNQIGAVATATRAVVVLPPVLVAMPLQSIQRTSAGIHFTLTNTPGTSFTVLCTTNLTQPLGQWTVLGNMVESPAGLFQFTDTGATNRLKTFYCLRSP